MRCLCSLAAIASFLVFGWSSPLRADDASARLEKIMAQVARTLDEADLPAAAKESVLRDLKQSLAGAWGADVEAQKPDADAHDNADNSESAAAEVQATEPADATQDRRDRSRQRMRAERRELRREPSRDPAAESRRAEASPDASEQQRRRAARNLAPEPPRYAIGVLLDESEEADTAGKLVIADVFPGSPAAEADLRSGDVILKLNGDEPTDPNEVTRRVDQAGRKDQPLSLEIRRGEEVLRVEVKPTARPGNLAFEFSRPDWSFPAAPGMPGFGGWRDPQWRFPTPQPSVDNDRIAEILERIERQDQLIEQMRQKVEHLQQQNPAEPKAEHDSEDSEEHSAPPQEPLGETF